MRLYFFQWSRVDRGRNLVDQPRAYSWRLATHFESTSERYVLGLATRTLVFLLSIERRGWPVLCSGGMQQASTVNAHKLTCQTSWS